MSGPPQVSVVITTCGRPRMLAEAVGSVLQQEMIPSEIIIVDDGGERDARDVVNSLPPDGPPVRVVDGPGKGPGAARNIGLRLANGGFVAFLDDDDQWAPPKTKEQAHWLARSSELGVLGTRAMTVRCRTFPVGSLRGDYAGPRPLPLRSLARANRLVLSSVMARRECLADVGGFDESLALAQDWDLWLRVAESGWGLALLETPFVAYHRHEGQRSANRTEMRRWECIVLKKALARREQGAAAPAVRRRLAWAHARLGRLLVREGQVEGGYQELRRSMSFFGWNPVVWAAAARCVLSRRVWQGARP